MRIYKAINFHQSPQICYFIQKFLQSFSIGSVVHKLTEHLLIQAGSPKTANIDGTSGIALTILFMIAKSQLGIYPYCTNSHLRTAAFQDFILMTDLDSLVQFLPWDSTAALLAKYFLIQDEDEPRWSHIFNTT